LLQYLYTSASVGFLLHDTVKTDLQSGLCLCLLVIGFSKYWVQKLSAWFWNSVWWWCGGGA